VKTALVLGGYGTFGSLVARELARLGVPVLVAGRDLARAEAFAREIGARGLRADAADPAPDLVTEDRVVVSCAGPFSGQGKKLLELCAERGAHYVDIADDRAHAARVRSLAPWFTRSSAVYGCSSLPAISLALLDTLNPGKLERVRITLFIGNDNPKGKAAIHALVQGLGKEIRAPQGPLRGFGGGETIELPVFGARRVHDFESPDYDLISAPRVNVKVGFELGLATRAFAVLARLSSSWGAWTARFFAALPAPRVGISGGVVQTEVWDERGPRKASLAAPRDGQRMAALPCALVAASLAFGREARGALLAHELLGARALLEAIAREGSVLST
jgi:predicted dinucleotide-binding enzyme